MFQFAAYHQEQYGFIKTGKIMISMKDNIKNEWDNLKYKDEIY